jgi:hypothetical protein
MVRQVKIVFCLVSLLLLLAPSAWAATRYVATTGTNSGDCTVSACLTVNYAISQADSGDTIQIAAGTYTGAGNRNITPADKSLAFLGVENNPSAVVLDAQDADGNFFLRNSTATNVTTTIRWLTLKDASAGSGSGVFVDKQSTGAADLIMQQCVVDGAEETDWRGAAIQCRTGTLCKIHSCLFINNDAQAKGLIIEFHNTAQPCELINCTVTGNILSAGAPTYPVVVRFHNGSHIVKNNIVYGNTGFTTDFRHVGAATHVTHNLFGSCTAGDCPDASNITDTDPLLNADYTLQGGSPAIDVGTPWMTYAEAQALGVTIYGGAPDIGAFERAQKRSLFPALSIWAVSPDKCGSINAACYVQE